MISFLKLIIILFLIGFIGDFILQFLSKYDDKIILFEPYWAHYGNIYAAIIAGLITLIIGGILIFLSVLIFKMLHLNTNSTSFIVFTTALAFVFGVVIDVWTNRNNALNGTLRLWYDTVGAEFASIWTGGFTFSLTVFIALYIMQMNKN